MKFFFLFVPILLFSQSSFSFLTISQNASGMATGNSFIIASEETAQEFIPSLLKKRETLLITFSQFKWFSGVSSKNIFLNSSYGKLAFGLAAKYYEITDIEQRNSASLVANSKFKNFYAMLGFSASYPISKHFRLGASYKMLKEKNYIYSVNGAAFDFSVSYQDKHFTSFLSVNTVFAYLERFIDRQRQLPKMLNFGFLYRFSFLSIGTEYHLINEVKNEFSFFAEKDLSKWLVLKTGYWFNHNVRSFSIGASVRYHRLLFTYSFAPHKYLDSYHIMQISFEL